MTSRVFPGIRGAHIPSRAVTHPVTARDSTLISHPPIIVIISRLASICRKRNSLLSLHAHIPRVYLIFVYSTCFAFTSAVVFLVTRPPSKRFLVCYMCFITLAVIFSSSLSISLCPTVHTPQSFFAFFLLRLPHRTLFPPACVCVISSPASHLPIRARQPTSAHRVWRAHLYTVVYATARSP